MLHSYNNRCGLCFRVSPNPSGGDIACHTCHILPPSEIPWRLFLAALQAQKGNIYFTELAERVEYCNYACVARSVSVRAHSSAHLRDKDLYITTNNCLQCLYNQHGVYCILNNWCICINLSCGTSVPTLHDIAVRRMALHVRRCETCRTISRTGSQLCIR